MKIVVPLAGPDLVHPVLGPKPLHLIQGRPLLALALASRPWFLRGEASDEDLIFVLREDAPGTAVVRAFLTAHYPGARQIVVSHPTRGALLSSLAGAAMIADWRGPLCIDLADILYRWPDYDPERLWSGPTGAVVPVFTANDPAFSYLRRQNGAVVEAAEKRVISEEASAGTYLFARPGTFLAAAGYAVDHAESLVHDGALYVCPAVNGVLAAGYAVAAPKVFDVDVVSRRFKPVAS